MNEWSVAAIVVGGCTATLSRLQYIRRRNECVHKMKEGRRETGEVSLAAGVFE